MIDLLDSEILSIEKVWKNLQDHVGRARNLQGFVSEVTHRFEDIGLVVDVIMYQDNDTGEFIPKIEIVGRCEPQKDGFDFERLQWEVREDILGIDPDKKGVTVPFDPDQLHQDDPAQYIADQAGISKSELVHDHGDSQPHTH